jgi:hypothetical protein
MRTLLLILVIGLLAGCVTIATPPTTHPVLPPTNQQSEPDLVCDPYEQPSRDKVPAEPIIPESDSDYVKYLEGLAELLVKHVVELRNYIDDEHAREDRAFRRYRQSCP